MELVRSEDTKAKIKASMAETHARRKSQICRVFELKVSIRHNPKSVFEKLSNCFKEAKWVINDMLSKSKDSSMFDYKYIEHKEVTHFDKDRKEVVSTITLPSVLHRATVAQKLTDICNLAKARQAGRKMGALKYKRQVNCIPIITGFTKIIDECRITIPGFRKLRVHGINQLHQFEEFEIADAKLLRKASGYYVKLTIMLPKTPRAPTHKSGGLDFGIKNTITTSDNKTYDCKVQETEYLKYLSKMLNRHKTQKDSSGDGTVGGSLPVSMNMLQMSERTSATKSTTTLCPNTMSYTYRMSKSRTGSRPGSESKCSTRAWVPLNNALRCWSRPTVRLCCPSGSVEAKTRSSHPLGCG